MGIVNKVILMGNLTREPMTKSTPSGVTICDMGLATNRRFRTAQGEEREETCFVDIEAFGRTAEICAQFLHKGSSAFFEGRLRLDQWVDKTTGQNRSRLKVVAETMQLVGAKEHAGQFPPPADEGNDYYNQTQPPPGAYQQQPPGAYQQQQPGAYQQQPPGAYQQQQPGTYQQQPPGAYQQQPPGAYQRQPPGAYQQQQPGAYQQQQPGAYQQQSNNPRHAPGGYRQPGAGQPPQRSFQPQPAPPAPPAYQRPPAPAPEPMPAAPEAASPAPTAEGGAVNDNTYEPIPPPSAASPKNTPDNQPPPGKAKPAGDVPF